MATNIKYLNNTKYQKAFNYIANMLEKIPQLYLKKLRKDESLI